VGKYEENKALGKHVEKHPAQQKKQQHDITIMLL
jgi:hypothetical protein